MPRPNDFIMTTDFPTLQNDGTASATGVITGGIVIAGGSYTGSQGDVTVGTAGAIARGLIYSSKNGNIGYVGNGFSFTRTGKVLGVDAAYSVIAFMWRNSPTTLRFQIYIPNPYADPLTTEAGDDTINMYAATFLAPFV